MPPRFTFGNDPTNEQTKQQQFKIDPSSVPAFTPMGEKGSKPKSDEISLEKAQLYVNKHFPQTVQGPTREQTDGLEKLAQDRAALDKGQTADKSKATADDLDQKKRDDMAFHQGQLEALQDYHRAPEGVKFMDVNADRESEYRAWERGQATIHKAVIEERWAKDTNIQNVASNEPMTLPTDTLSKQGDRATVTTYTADGEALHNSYRLEKDRVVHTQPNGYEKTMTVAESRAHQADRQADVTRNTANALEGMKADPKLSFRQGEYTFSVTKDKVVRTDLDGNTATMPLAKFEENMRHRQEQAAATQKQAHRDLKADNKERAEIKDTLEKRSGRGEKAEVVTYDKERNPTKWTLDQQGELRGEKVARSTDLNKETERFKAKIEAHEDAKAFNGQKTVVGRLREKEADQGQGATVKNPHNGDVYRLSEDGKKLHCEDKNGKAKGEPVDAEQSHKNQTALNSAKVAEQEKERAK
ncbi:hypothetical protein G8E10_24820 [Rhizobiaceae bacterium CRRU44]|uniref:DUF3945 domain-containing protein n=1 Tax=Ferranicluibacter rubi TaxID=2715133 RepID=A0AA43ZL02_9HYPH|nr:hypothetical protein [Ferranicluibacter rubi]NHT78926.1 hypothetical protein [Ferranicluibacter rubi]